MKKTLGIIFLSGVIILLLFANLSVVAGADQPIDNSQILLEQRLIGTWRWESQHSWIVVFREDGTMLDGPPGLRLIYDWRIVDGRLFIDGEDRNLRITDNAITFDRSHGTYTYVWYSDSIEGATSFWLPVIIGIAILAVITIVIVLLARRSRRKNQQMQSWQPQMQSWQSQPAPNHGGWKCPCGTENCHNFCRSCGRKRSTILCQNCGAPVEPGANFCRKCGHKM